MEKAVSFRTIMNEPYRDHPSEDALERFLLQQSEDEELEIVETHFLACEICVTRLETLELNIAATKLALRNHQAEQLKKLAQPAPQKRRWFGLPQLSLAGVAMAACTIAITFVSVPRNVILVAERGTKTQTVAEWVPLTLHLQARELKAGPVTVKIVNRLGQDIWEGEAVVKEEEISVKIPRLTAPGTYLVRVYSPTASDPVGDLVREYAMNAHNGL